MKSILKITLIFFLITDFLKAQLLPENSAKPLQKFGFVSDFNWNFHSADFKELPGVENCCPLFESGRGAGFTIGGLYERSVFKNFSLGLRASYATQDATLRSIQTKPVVVANKEMKGEIEHTISSGIATFGVEPLLLYNPFGRFTMQFGGRLGYMLSGSYAQQEQIISPSSGVFKENDSRIRNEREGDIPDAQKLQTALLFGASHEFPLNSAKNLFLAPEIFFQLSLSRIIPNTTWNANTLRFGLALKYAPADNGASGEIAEKPIEKKEILKEKAAKKPLLKVAVSAVALDEADHEMPLVQVKFEEFVSTQMRPLLPYVFFEENSAEIPQRYSFLKGGETTNFTTEKLHGFETLPTYYHLLNIIGSRLEKTPRSTITITGCNANEGAEKNNIVLSKQRAEAVKRYLTIVWNIAGSRLKIATRNLPENFSKTIDADTLAAIVENRRVEIASDDAEILKPVITNDTLRTVTPPFVRFKNTVESEVGLQAWNLKVFKNGTVSGNFSGRNELTATIDWKPDIPLKNEFLKEYRFELSGSDRTGQNFIERGTIAVENITVNRKRTERIADREIDRYSLILFDFNSSDLSTANKSITEFIKGRISANSRIKITGFTDRLGDESYNKTLSADRAKATAKALLITPEAVAEGETELHDNALPEGRFYNRTVNVIVETPVP
ncbi:MAG: OmpA family protein [Bacteroidota bacterium]